MVGALLIPGAVAAANFQATMDQLNRTLSEPPASLNSWRRRVKRLERANVSAKLSGDRNRSARINAAYRRLTNGDLP